MSTRKIIAYEIVDHGVEHGQYFQGCGVAFTSFDEVYTGCGFHSLREALENAAEQLALSGFEVPADLNAEIDAADESDAVTQSFADCGIREPEDHSLHYYASIRVKIETETK